MYFSRIRMQNARYWMLTMPQHCYMPYLPPGVSYIKGQLEEGAGGYSHWQILCILPKPQRLAYLKKLFGQECHAEPTRSAASEAYVWKQETSVSGTQFVLGEKAIKRNSSKDWEKIKQDAKAGKLDDIPADIYVRNYRTLKAIEKDNLKASAMERKINVYWGKTGAGKSHAAWEEAGLDAYPKDPNTKYWDGYQGQENVVIDEFRGKIDISHMLRWCDKYPVVVENKFGACVFKAKEIWITSNISPEQWYPDLDEETKQALLRRLTIKSFS